MPEVLHLFAWDTAPGMLLYGRYDPWLVTLSVAIAMFSSTMGLQAAFQARGMPTWGMRQLTLLAGSLSLGCGVWAMHFVGMLSFQLCTTVHYAPKLTLFSMLPSLAASFVALELISGDTMTRGRLWIGGLLVGSGIGAMHYLGMAAMQMSAVLRYDPLMFAVSIVVAVTLAMVSLWVRFGVADSASLGRLSSATQAVIGGGVMGLAVAGMHYTGMAAARFMGTPQSATPMGMPDAVTIALSITLVSMTTTVLVAGATGLARYRQLIEQLQKKGARLRAISHSSLDGIIVFDAQGTVQDFNPGAQRIYGWQPQEVIGQHVGMLMPPALRTAAQADFPAFLQQLDLVGRGERDTVGHHREGHDIAIRLVIERMQVPGSDLHVAFVSDITDRVRMARDLQESEAQFRSLISNIPGVAYRCRMEPGWPMVFVSDAVESVTGYPAGDFVGPMATVRLADLVPKADISRVARMVDEAQQSNRHFVLEFQLRHRDGSLRWIWASGSIVRGGERGQVQWIDGVLLDISERRRMEDELRVAKEKAEAAAQARSTFLANMSHEIRTPMNAIMGFTDVVLSGTLPDDQRKHLETVHKSARNLLHLLNDILDSSKLEQGALTLEKIDFSLPDLVAQLCAEQSIHARRKQLGLRHDIDAGVGDHVQGDPHRLRQILLNLLGNAIKFTERGSVTLSVRRDPEGVHFSVRDTGIGIAPDRLPHIFDAFTQADASMSRRFGGTGLGTTIAKQLTELMGGRIWAESTPGEGSVFHVCIPLAAGSADQALRDGPSTHVLRLAPLRVLAADDVPQNLELISLLLGRQGHTVTTAGDGQQALAATEGAHFDIILMDVQMPVMDGLAACRALREREQASGHARTPVLALSASVLLEDRQAAIDAGMDGFATKPVDLAQLMKEIARVTGRTPVDETAAASAPPQLAADAQLVDTARALAIWQDTARYLQALQRFIDSEAGPPAIAASAPADADAAFQHAHRLKGLAATLGLVRIEDCAAQVEALARQAAHEGLGAAWQAMTQALQRTRTEIERLLHTLPATDAGLTPTSAAPAAAEVDLPPLRRRLQRLHQAFLRGECLDALLKEVQQPLRAWITADELAALNEHVELFDFDAAAATIARMAQALPTDPETADAPL
ncbi:MAG: MHYT domain-containing protein [Aquabacterium sp.]